MASLHELNPISNSQKVTKEMSTLGSDNDEVEEKHEEGSEEEEEEDQEKHEEGSEEEEEEQENDDENDNNKKSKPKKVSNPTPQELVTLLKSIKQPGDFSEHGTLESFVSPGLEVEGIGMIGLPLSETQAHQLKQKCTQAPFGRGEKTILDTTVRKTLQLQPSQFKLNYAFQSNTIREIKGKLQQGLGVLKREVNLELYKLLLYDEGSFFTKHRDSEKSDGMFATLVVLLPSVYEGGEIVIYHGNEKRSIDLSKQNKHELGWISFYADCEHEVSPLKSGYRLALVYNVCFAPSPSPIKKSEILIPTSVENSFLTEFGEIYQDWNERPSMIGIRLSHSYSHKSLKIDHLKNGDHAMVSALRTLSKYYPIEVYLVTIGKNSSSRDDGYVQDLNYHVEHWVDVNNQVVPFGSIPIDPKCLFPRDSFRNVKSYDEKQEDTGNEGTIVERWYRFGFVLIWPLSFSRRVFVNNNAAVLAYFKTSLLEAQQVSPTFDRTNEKWKKVLSLCEKLGDLAPDDTVKVIEMMTAIDDIDDPIGRKNTKQFIASPSSISGTNPDLISTFVSLIMKYGGWSQWKETIFECTNSLIKPSAMLIWLLNDCVAVRPSFIKTNEEREEIRKVAMELVQMRRVRPPMCLVISKLGDISFAQNMLPKFLEKAWITIHPPTSNDVRKGPEMTFPHICSLLQGFGFNYVLCEIVQNFLTEKLIDSHAHVVYAVWSMFFQQTSLRRLRVESTKHIVRFGRLIGTNKNLSNKKVATLKLVLNEFASSRLSAKETNQLIVGSFNRSTLGLKASEKEETDDKTRLKSQQTHHTRWESDSEDDYIFEKTIPVLTPIPIFVKSIFVTGYLEPPKVRNQKFSSNFWDIPFSSLNNDVVGSDGPSGIGGEAKQKFAKSLCSNLFTSSTTIQNPIKQVQELSVNGGRFATAMMVSLAVYVNNWEKFREILTLTNDLTQKQASPMFFDELIDSLVVAVRTFQSSHFQDLSNILRIVLIRFPSPRRASFFQALTNTIDFEKNTKIGLNLISNDYVFWSDFEKHDLFSWTVQKLKAAISILEKSSLPSIISFSDENFKNYVSQRPEKLSSRLILICLIEMFDKTTISDWKPFKDLLCIAKYVATSSQDEMKQGKKLIQLVADHLFIALFPPKDSADKYRERYKIPIPPANYEETMDQICKIFFHPVMLSLGIVLSEPAINVLCGVYAHPSFFRAKLLLGTNKKHYLKLLEQCIPPTPFPITPDKNVLEWTNFMNSTQDDSFTYNAYGTFLTSFNKFEYFRFFEAGKPLYGGFVLRKRYLPYLELKKKYEAAIQLDKQNKINDEQEEELNEEEEEKDMEVDENQENMEMDEEEGNGKEEKKEKSGKQNKAKELKRKRKSH